MADYLDDFAAGRAGNNKLRDLQNKVRNEEVRVNVTEGSNTIRSELEFLRSGKANLNLNLTASGQGGSVLASLPSQIANAKAGFAELNVTISQISSGADKAATALGKMATASRIASPTNGPKVNDWSSPAHSRAADEARKFIANEQGLLQKFLGRSGGSAVGASAALLGGAGGAAIGQAAGALVEPILNAINERKSAFVEAGRSYSEAILAISATLQESSSLIDTRTGRFATNDRDLSGQINYQQTRAEAIQQATRAQLNPLGIAGASEANIARSTAAALGQRFGGDIDPKVVAQVARALGGTAAALDPALLGTARLPQDIGDILSGSPRGRSTALGQRIPRDVLEQIQSARSSKDLVGAVSQLQAFGDVFSKSIQPAALEARIRGQEELLNSRGGQGYFRELAPGLQDREELLKSPELLQAADRLGAAFGRLEASSIIIADKFAKFAVPIGEAALSAATGDTRGLSHSAFGAASFLTGGKFDSMLKPFEPIADLILKIAQGGNLSGATGSYAPGQTQDQQLKSALAELKLDDAQKKYSEAENPFTQLSGLNSVISRFGASTDSDVLKRLPFAFNQRGSVLEELEKVKAQGFAPTEEGQLGKARSAVSFKDQEIANKQQELSAVRNAESVASETELLNLKGREAQIEQQLLSLQSQRVAALQQEAQIRARQSSAFASLINPSTVSGADEGGTRLGALLRTQRAAQEKAGASPAELAATENQEFEARERAAKSFQVANRARELGINKQTSAGRQLNSKLSIQNDQKTIAENNKLIAGYKDELSKPGLDFNQRLIRQQRIEGLTNENRGSFVDIAQQQQQQRLQPFQDQGSAAQLNLALSASGRLIQEESNKRLELNSQLAASAAALDNFRSRLDEQDSGAKVQAIQAAREVEKNGGNVSGIDTSDEALQQAQKDQAVARFNGLASRNGYGQGAGGLVGGTPFAQQGSQQQTESQLELAKLNSGIFDTSAALTDLASVFKQKAAELGETVASKKYDLNGVAEPRAEPSAADLLTPGAKGSALSRVQQPHIKPSQVPHISVFYSRFEPREIQYAKGAHAGSHLSLHKSAAARLLEQHKANIGAAYFGGEKGNVAGAGLASAIFGGLAAHSDRLLPNPGNIFQNGASYLEKPNAQIGNLQSSQLPPLTTTSSGGGTGADVGTAIRDALSGLTSGKTALDSDSMQQLATLIGTAVAQVFSQ